MNCTLFLYVVNVILLNFSPLTMMVVIVHTDKLKQIEIIGHMCK